MLISSPAQQQLCFALLAGCWDIEFFSINEVCLALLQQLRGPAQLEVSEPGEMLSRVNVLLAQGAHSPRSRLLLSHSQAQLQNRLESPCLGFLGCLVHDSV